jgi:hypothetical protein
LGLRIDNELDRDNMLSKVLFALT